jgi:hypothetical protein
MGPGLSWVATLKPSEPFFRSANTTHRTFESQKHLEELQIIMKELTYEYISTYIKLILDNLNTLKLRNLILETTENQFKRLYIYNWQWLKIELKTCSFLFDNSGLAETWPPRAEIWRLHAGSGLSCVISHPHCGPINGWYSLCERYERPRIGCLKVQRRLSGYVAVWFTSTWRMGLWWCAWQPERLHIFRNGF